MNKGIVYFPAGHSTVPRVVAAKIKQKSSNEVRYDPIDCCQKPVISGDLWIVDKYVRHRRYAEVKNGSLILSRYVGASKEFDFRIPLFNLNINLDLPKHWSQFSLSEYGKITPMATFQVVLNKNYDKWLKALAVEIIKQTPLNTLKFLDVLFVSELATKPPKDYGRETFSKVARRKQRTAECPTRNVDRVDQPHEFHPIQYDLNHNERPSDEVVDFIEPDFVNYKTTTSNNSFDLCGPLTASAFDKMIKSSDSFDSGFCSLQSYHRSDESADTAVPKIIELCDTAPKTFDEILRQFETPEAKPKAKLKRSDSFRASVSTSCLNLINKFKKLSSKENDPRRLRGECKPCEDSRGAVTWPKKNNAAASKGRAPTSQFLGHERNAGIGRYGSCQYETIGSAVTVGDVWRNDGYEYVLEGSGKPLESIGGSAFENLNDFDDIGPRSLPTHHTAGGSSLTPAKVAKFNYARASAADAKSGRTRTEHESANDGDENFRKTFDVKKRRQTVKFDVNDVVDSPRSSNHTPAGKASRKPSFSAEIAEQMLQNENASNLIRLLTRCQIDKQYVPVREKRLLFESLSRFSFSEENLRKRETVKSKHEDHVKFCSLSNLHTSPTVPVKLMKEYFESFLDSESPVRSPVRGHTVRSKWSLS